MSADLFGNRFLGRSPAWHSLGTVIDPSTPLTIAQAIELAGADYEVRTTKLVTEAFGRRIDTGRVAIVRQPTNDDPEARILGIASKAYKIIQNRELADAITPISEANDWPVETVGALARGAKFFLTLKAASFEVEGDGEVVNYFLIADGKDGGSATSIAVTPVRVVCQNTLVAGLSAATIRATTIHKGDAIGQVRFKASVVAQMHAGQTAVQEAMRLLAKKTIDQPYIDAILDAAYDRVPQMTRGHADLQALLDSTVTIEDAQRQGMEASISGRQQWLESVKLYRSAAVDRLQIFNDEYPRVANTPWAVYNAIAETEQYRRGKSDTTIGRDVVFGGFRGKNVAAAFDKAYAIAAGN